jgi:tRNA G18 (ribose-2'-O)-methylase SpoU
LADPDNVGGVFRNALAFGVDAVLLSPGTADPLYRKAIRVSAGATLCLPFARLSAWEAGLRRVQEGDYTLVALTPEPAAVDIATFARVPSRLALAVGAEGHGLGATTRAAAQLLVRIPMAAGVDSLNVATATGIALHRLRGSR